MAYPTFKMASLLFTLAGLLLATNAWSYLPTDVAKDKVTLPNAWKMGQILRAEGQIATSYTKSDNSEPKEALAEIAIVKDKGKDTLVMLQEMSSRVAKQLKDAGCQGGGLAPVAQDFEMLRVWSESFQCKRDKSSIMQLYIDADAKTFYLFTYTKDIFPLTPEAKEEMYNFLKDAIEICYQEKLCYSLD
jgi:hypothetical protein